MKGFNLDKALAQQQNCLGNSKTIDKEVDGEFCRKRCKRCARLQLWKKYHK
jgi:hypothetical protein